MLERFTVLRKTSWLLGMGTRSALQLIAGVFRLVHLGFGWFGLSLCTGGITLTCLRLAFA